MREITIEVYHAELKAQGVPTEHLAMKCPMCGTIQSGFDLLKAGAGSDFNSIEKYLGFSCVGRWTHRKPPPPAEERGVQIGCNWTLGGFLPIHELSVIADGEKHKRFELCTPEEARAHMEENLR